MGRETVNTKGTRKIVIPDKYEYKDTESTKEFKKSYAEYQEERKKGVTLSDEDVRNLTSKYSTRTISKLEPTWKRIMWIILFILGIVVIIILSRLS